MLTIFYVILVLFLPAQLIATQVNDFVSVNISFLDSLRGPVKDAVVFKNWSDTSGVGSLNLSDADISDGKKGILDQIRQFVKDKPNFSASCFTISVFRFSVLSVACPMICWPLVSGYR